jgi:hypothetical protein
MNNLVGYRIVTYVLLFVAAFLSMGLLTNMLAALANPVALLPLFLVACVIIYTYCSWRFLVRGIDRGITLKTSLRDLIKVNAYITMALSAIVLFQMIILLSNPEMIGPVLEQAKAAQPAGSEMSDEMLHKMIRATMMILLGYAVLLLIHSFITMRLIRRYAQVFEDTSANTD